MLQRIVTQRHEAHAALRSPVDTVCAPRCLRLLALIGILSVVPATSHAATDAQLCVAAFYAAAGKHALCEFGVRGKATLNGTAPDYTKCEAAYIRRMQRAYFKYAGCPQIELTGVWMGGSERFVDNGDGTIIDNATGLQWEMKDNTCPGIHCVNDAYTWSSDGPDPDGTIFTVFLGALNSGGGFAGHPDWRLPTLTELQAILLAPWPTCGRDPCIDPIFGPIPPVLGFYWTSTPAPIFVVGEGANLRVYSVGFSSGGFDGITLDAFKTNASYVRAVRSTSLTPAGLCGSRLCPPGTGCCNPLLGICVPPGGFCAD